MDPRRAEAALEGVLGPEGLLEGVEHAVVREPLDGLELGPVGLDGEEEARADGDAVHPGTVQAPQTPCSQPTCVPVSPSVWRRKSERRSLGSASSR